MGGGGLSAQRRRRQEGRKQSLMGMVCRICCNSSLVSFVFTSFFLSFSLPYTHLI